MITRLVEVTRTVAEGRRWVRDSTDAARNPILGVGRPMNGVRNRVNGVRNRVNGVWNLIFGVPDPKFGVNDLKTASKWRGYGFAGVSGVAGELAPLRLKKTLRVATFSAAPGAEAPALYWV